MGFNPRIKFLRQFFLVEEKENINKEKGEMREISENGEDKKTEQENIIPKKMDLDLSKTFRSEFNFLKFPFFDLSARMSKKDRIEIREIEETETEKIEIIWQVSRNIDSEFPSSFARRVHKEVIEKSLNNTKRPVPRLIKLGSLRQICKTMKISPSGGNCNEIKKALENIKSAKITTKGTFRKKEKNGKKKYHEGHFNLYDMVFFTGETLPDGTGADSVYILLNDMYIRNFNYNYVVPMDYKYFQFLEGDIASRMYEIFIIWFFPALENGKNYIDKEYSTLCNYFPLTRQNEKWKAKGQLKKAHQQHLLSGFLATEPEWININKKNDWQIRYWIGEKAKNWHLQNKKLANTGKEIKKINFSTGKEEDYKKTEKKSEEKAKGDFLVEQLIALGVTQKVADDLVEHSHPRAVEDWIEAIHETKAKDKPAFLVKAIKEKWELPEIFKIKREEKKKKEAMIRKEKITTDLSDQYEKYKNERINFYLRQISQEQKEIELQKIKQSLVKKYPIAKTWHGKILESTLKATFLDNIKKEINLLSFQDWLEKEKNIQKEKIFEVEKIEEKNDFESQTMQQTL